MKKIIALILVLATVLSMNILVLGTSAADENADEVVTLPNGDKMRPGFIDYATDGYAVDYDDENWVSLTEKYESDDNWTAISSADDFKTKVKAGGKYYLTADIDLKTVAAASDYYVHAGSTSSSNTLTIDGCGHTITTDKPIFRILPYHKTNGTSSEVKNLVIAGEISLCAASAYTASICSLVCKAQGGTYENIVNCAPITQEDEEPSRVGGIIGSIWNIQGTIKNCINNAPVTGYSAQVPESSYVKYGVGGIVGVTAVGVEFIDVVNNGAVKSTNNSYTGGIVGLAYNKAISIVRAKNYVPVTGGIAGGIIGEAYVATTAEDCYNEGAIKSTYNSINGFAGGLVGHVRSTGEITNSTNIGDVSGYCIAGGIVGSGCANDVVNNVNITNCTNDGNISSTDSAGGILGYTKTNATIKYCLNTGDVEVSDTYIDTNGSEQTRTADGTADASYLGAGGIVGHLTDAGVVTIEYCGVTGNVSVSSNLNRSTGNGEYAGVGGIIAYAQAEGTSVTNCFVTGDVSETRDKDIFEDNFVGRTEEANIAVSDNYFYENADAPEVVGGKLAFLMQTDNTYWGQDIGNDMYPVLNGADGAKVKKFGEADVYYEGDLYKNVALGEKFIVQYFVDGYDYDAENDAKATFKFLGVDKEVVAVNGEGDYAYQLVFKFDKIAPQFIGEEIAVTFPGSELKDDSCTTVKHLEDTAKEYADNAELQALIKAAICYGYEARAYVKDETIDVIESTDYMGDLNGDMPEDNMELNNSSDSVAFKAANINFNDVNKLYFRYKADAESIVTIKATKKSDGATVEFDTPVLDKEGEYIVYSAPIMACDYDDQFIVELYDDGALAATLTYGIYDYAARMQDDEIVGNLAKATYFYGICANAYAEQQQ